ncbi:uncharacterized protein [Haliotis cracherodii]|uniref:uncharacterized protein n=1 Tax=Haliotis cracherodii TaxID=6455 RepID=UPI0039EA99A6
MSTLCAFLLTLGVLARASVITVDDLQPVAFAYRTVDGNSVTYKCYDGYVHTAGSSAVTVGSDWEYVLPVCSNASRNLNEPESVIYDKNGTCDAAQTVQVSLGFGNWEIHGLSFTTNFASSDIQKIAVNATVADTSVETISLCGNTESSTLVKVSIRCSGNGIIPVGNLIIISVTYPTAPTATVCDIMVYGRQILPSAAQCENPPTLYGLRLESQTFNSDSNGAVYTCEEGFYHQSGAGDADCRSNGTWSLPSIKCSNEDNIISNSTHQYVAKNSSTCPQESVIFEFDNTTSYEVASVTIFFNESVTSDFTVEAEVVDIKQTPTSSRACASDTLRTSPSTASLPKPITLYCETFPVGQFLSLKFNSSIPQSLVEVRATGRQYTDALECTQTKEGWDYKGKVNISVSGTPCQRWDSLPSSLAIPDALFSAGAPENYCRSPAGSESVTGTVIRPWCYINIINVTWEYCPIGKCNRGCVVDSLSMNYRGMLGVTTSNKKCLSWKKEAVPFQIPSTFPDGSPDHKFCRNPGESLTKPWCYTSLRPPTAEVCDVDTCPTSLPAVTTGEVYFKRASSVIANILECFSWNGDGARPWDAQRWTLDMGVVALYTHFCEAQRPLTFMCLEKHGATVQWTYGSTGCVNCVHVPVTPVSQANSSVSYEKGVATYTCDNPADMEMIGSATVNCIDGQWEPPRLECKPRNVARTKTTKQDSTKEPYTASRAVDDNLSVFMDKGGCSHTSPSQLSNVTWWQVDLGDLYNITTVELTSRGDCCGDKLGNFTVTMHTADPETSDAHDLCLYHPGFFGNGVTKSLPCDQPTVGRYVKITQYPRASELYALELCDVIIRGLPAQDATTTAPTTSTATTAATDATTTAPTTPTATTAATDVARTAQTTSTATTAATDVTTTAPTTPTATTATTDLTMTVTTTSSTTPMTTTTTTPTTTSYNPFPKRKVVEMCTCRCKDTSLPSDTKQVTEAAQAIQKELKVETKTLSKSVQKKTSSKDKRSSSTNMGFLAISLMCVVFGAVVIPDVASLVTAVYNTIKGV